MLNDNKMILTIMQIQNKGNSVKQMVWFHQQVVESERRFLQSEKRRDILTNVMSEPCLDLLGKNNCKSVY